MISELIAGVFLIAVIYILVRPGGQGAEFVKASGAALASIIGQATDQSNSSGTADSGTADSGN